MSIFTEVEISKKDSKLIMKIVNRVQDKVNSIEEVKCKFDKMAMSMDLEVVHHFYGLDLEGLLKARSEDLFHDVSGISWKLDRSTGKLGDCFLPRFAIREERNEN